MNQTSTFNLLNPTNTNKFSTLPGSDGAFVGLPSDAFAGDLKAAIQEMLSAGGKLKPLDIAGLKGLDVQQLTDLAVQVDIELPPELLPEPVDLKKLPLNILVPETDSATDGISVLGNPNTNELLKEKVSNNLTNNSLLDDGLLSQQISKPDLFNKNTVTDVIHQSVLKKEPDLVQAISDPDIDLSQYLKLMSKDDVDLKSEFLQTGLKETNITKLIDQLAAIDKPANTISPVSNYLTQATSTQEQSGLMLRRIDVPVNQPGWSEAVGNRLMMMVNDKMQSANIHLNPPELGPIEVRVNVNKDQASVHFISGHAAVRDAVEEAFPRLREMFMQNGISLTDANVSQQSPQQQGNAYSSEQDGSLATMTNDSLENPDTQTASIQDKSVALGLIDHYV